MMNSAVTTSRLPKCDPFPGFTNGSRVVDALNRPHNKDLKQFAGEFFTQVSSTNVNGRWENPANESEQFFDAMAQLIMADEVCSAFAISGTDILATTNQGDQNRKAVSWTFTMRILDKTAHPRSLRIMVKCLLKSETGEQIEKELGPITYEINRGKVIFKDDPELNFKFLRGEFPYLPDDQLSIHLSLKEINLDYFNFLFQLENNQEIQIIRPIVTCIGPLQRRISKLFALLSLISNATLRNKAWFTHTPEDHRPYFTFVKEKYKNWKKNYVKEGCDDFIESITRAARKTFHLNKKTLSQFLELARGHFEALETYDYMRDIVGRHDQWVQILNDNLTLELARHDRFTDHLSTPQAREKMTTFYRELIADYKSYRTQKHLKPSVISATSWLKTLETKAASFHAPDFIQDNFDLFCDIAPRYFYNLAFVEEYIKANAKQNGTLAQRLSNENIFKKPNVIIIDGKEGVHAEMRLLSYHLLNQNKTDHYYGIAKLCCALCHYTLKQFNVSGMHPSAKSRGTHAILFTWPLPEALNHDAHMATFLGTKLFVDYKKLASEKRRLDSSKRGPYFDPKEIIWALIERLDGLNSEKNLKKLGINPKSIMPRSGNQYPDFPTLPSEA